MFYLLQLSIDGNECARPTHTSTTMDNHWTVILAIMIFINPLLKGKQCCAIFGYTMIWPHCEMKLSHFPHFIFDFSWCSNLQGIMIYMATISLWVRSYRLNTEDSDTVFCQVFNITQRYLEVAIHCRTIRGPILMTLDLQPNNIQAYENAYTANILMQIFLWFLLIYNICW